MEDQHASPRPDRIRIDEHGDQTHESWLLVRANHVSSHPGRRLFDSEITHQHYVQVTVSRCSRKRDLKRDWHHAEKVLIEFDMSEVQWGAFVSSFGQGGGVPATLSRFDGATIPDPVNIDSRLSVTQAEVRAAADEATRNVQAAEQAVQEAFERGAGKRELRELMRTLHHAIGNLPANMEFAATAMTEHMENVVTRARADVESMVVMAAHAGMSLDGSSMLALEGGDQHRG